MKKRKISFGLKLGFAFCMGSILLTYTFIGPLYILFFTEPIGAFFDDLFGIHHIGKSTFGLCLFMLIFVLVLYSFSFKMWTPSIQDACLFLLFLSILIFLNSLLFYADFIKPNFKMDGQQAFGIIRLPLVTSWIYLIIGYFHSFLRQKMNGTPSNKRGNHLSQ